MTNSNSEPPKTLSEFALIAELFAPLTARMPLAFGLTDDAAIIRPDPVPGEELVVTVDALVEGVHFLHDDPAGLIAKKALRVNLSDLAAKGAQASHYLLALSLPDWIDDAWLTSFAAGLEEDQMRYGIGSDRRRYHRDARAADALRHGAGKHPRGPHAAPGGRQTWRSCFRFGNHRRCRRRPRGAERQSLQSLSAAHRENLIRRYRLPEPRLDLGARLIGLASAALDVSDGLIADIGHIADVSGVRIVLEAVRLPISSANWRHYGVDGVACVSARCDCRR